MSQVLMHGQSAAECREKVREASVSTEMEASGTHRGILDFNLMVLFDAMMQERNLTRAASRLGLSQSAGSHALARLRQVLHDDLFVRGPDGMHPTPRAEQIAEPWREALRMLRMTLEPDTFDPSTATRSFVVGVDNYAARAVVPSLARTVGMLSPRTRLDVRPIGGLNILDQLDAGAMDAALSKLIDGGERFKCIRIMDDDYVALVDREHPVANGPVMSIEDVARIPHIAISSGSDGTGFVDDVLEQHGFTRQIAIHVPLVSLVLMLIGSNRLAVVPRRVAIGLARICPLAVKELPFPSPRISLSMIWHRRLNNPAAHRWLRDRIREAAQVLAAD